jgi:ABC-2 type transport system ATP-binding protein
VSVLEAVGLTKRYRRVRALNDCRLSLPEGSVVALVGPNGTARPARVHRTSCGA